VRAKKEPEQRKPFGLFGDSVDNDAGHVEAACGFFGCLFGALGEHDGRLL
jgi:hypothetical protein